MVNSKLIQREEEEKEEEKEEGEGGEEEEEEEEAACLADKFSGWSGRGEGGGGEEREREEERKREREREVLMVRSREMACGISFEATATSTVLFLLVSNVNLNEHVLLLNHFYTRYTDILQHLPLPLTFFIFRDSSMCVSFACLDFSSPRSRRRNVTRNARNEEFITPFEKFIFFFFFFLFSSLLRRMLNLKGARYWPVNHPNSRCLCFELLRSIGEGNEGNRELFLRPA